MGNLLGGDYGGGVVLLPDEDSTPSLPSGGEPIFGDPKDLGSHLITLGAATVRTGSLGFATFLAVWAFATEKGDPVLAGYAVKMMQVSARMIAAGIALIVVGRLLVADPPRFDMFSVASAPNPYVPRVELGSLAWAEKGMQESALRSCVFGLRCLVQLERAQGARAVGDPVVLSLAEGAAQGYAKLASRAAGNVLHWLHAFAWHPDHGRRQSVNGASAEAQEALRTYVRAELSGWAAFVPGVASMGSFDPLDLGLGV
jgi:hypothetical protein